MSALLISVPEAAERLGLRPQTARNWLWQGRFPVPTVTLGRRRLVRVQDLEAFVASLKPEIGAGAPAGDFPAPAAAEPATNPARRGPRRKIRPAVQQGGGL